ncbi:hypothetical protein [Nocardia albiluteola]|nr:hypothetical protein [Nocardia albiluteola]
MNDPSPREKLLAAALDLLAERGRLSELTLRKTGSWAPSIES